MGDPALERLLKRDRAIVAVCLVVMTVLAWLYLLSLARSMGAAHVPVNGAGTMEGMPGMEDMPGMDMSGMQTSDVAPAGWNSDNTVLVVAMWFVMMVGMMLPSAAPMILLYARVGRHASAKGAPFAATGVFCAGYLAVWFLFSLAATLAQWILEQAVLITPMLDSASPLLSAALLITAGLYQWTPLKSACLGKCRAPAAFLQAAGGFRRDAAGAFLMGMRHGAYCVGCCWPLMLLLFVGGVMNILWIAVIAIFVLAEKLLPGGDRMGRAAGVVLIAAGAWLMLRGMAHAEPLQRLSLAALGMKTPAWIKYHAGVHDLLPSTTPEQPTKAAMRGLTPPWRRDTP
ncbi:predicted metal-binding membrane protein [Rhizobium subbaraonis]|uniref:Predicted metal-binding membrane protein n=1 Tax=Rhizobium subbaraonis TaxID=908946 RepID=A0A285UR29_9HYPH|nr:predicted metal-binding membrane protein [Rhizobium subbaraonis]